jgi:hypothetical protein
MHVTAKSHAKRRSFTWIGFFCLVLSVFTILLSIGMPGVGWMVAAGVLIVCSAITPWIGKRYIAGSLVVSILHLFSFGPLPLLGGAAAVHSWPPVWFLACFVAFPLLLAVMTLFFGGRKLFR